MHDANAASATPREAPSIPLHEVELYVDHDGPSPPPSEVLVGSGDQIVDLGDLQDRIAINVIHDGRVVPGQFMYRRGERVDKAELHELYARERDWGASLVAAELAGALGLDGYLNINIARVLMDFGRFPGLTPHNATYMERLAVNTPFAQWLDFKQKWALLDNWYDAISDHMDKVLIRKVLTIGVHTYDVYNESGTLRPEISVLNRAMGYQQHSRMPLGLFDPLYPDRLGEFTCDRVLPSRISLHLERSGLPVALNYPYCLPEGSVEVRSQVWHFFDFVRQRMEAAQPEIVGDGVYDLVWTLLLDTNLRSSDCQALRSYLHMFRTAPKGRKREFQAARQTYDRIQDFVRADDGKLIDEYRFGAGRPGAIGIEVRKDLVWDFDSRGNPVAPRPDKARRLARLIAQAIAHYFTEDRARRIPFNQALRSPEPPHDLGMP